MRLWRMWSLVSRISCRRDERLVEGHGSEVGFKKASLLLIFFRSYQSLVQKRMMQWWRCAVKSSWDGARCFLTCPVNWKH